MKGDFYMRKLLKNEQGISLLYAIGVLLIFTVLGLSLIAITSSGVAKNSTRENIVQSQDLADKGIDFAVKDIQATLEKGIKNNPMGKAAFETFLLSTLNNPNLSCTKGIEIPADNNNKTTVCIENIEPVSAEEKDKYKRLVTFKSTGKVNNKQHVTSSQIIIGTDAIPDQLRYAVSTNDGGNLFLHGGIEIQGDIKTSGNLIVTDHASWGTATGNKNTWTSSVYPRIIKDNKSISPKIIMPENNSNFYIFNLNNSYFSSNSSTDYYLNKLITGSDLNNNSNFTKISPEKNNTEIKNAFFNTKDLAIFTRTIKDDTVDIDKEFNFTTNPTSTVEDMTKNSSILNNKLKDNVYHIKKITTCTKEGKYGCISSKTSSGSIKIEGSSSVKTNTTLIGKFYVEGDVNISYTNLTSDAILYVKGNVSIDQSILKNLNNDSTLFIFANGDITFSNMHDSLYSNTDSINEARGFFYSKSNMMILGVRSHMRIIGGISGKRIILTGVRGKGKDASFDSVSTQKNKNSRLQVRYDEGLIAKYHSFKRDLDEEFITEINEPEMVKRF